MPSKCGSVGGRSGGVGGSGTAIGAKLEPIEERRLAIAERDVVANERATIALERVAHCFNHLCVALIALIEICQRVAENVEKEAIESRERSKPGRTMGGDR